MAVGAGVPAASAAKGNKAQVWRVAWRVPGMLLWVYTQIKEVYMYIYIHPIFGSLSPSLEDENTSNLDQHIINQTYNKGPGT